ncbi:MAG: LysM peptidoglycan-binding domain-containing protein [Verrucomicrobiota bacterium]|nr:LysM peptidoglycan-binding domain-containing protein [Verrucomicrobiota bacterium]
MEGEKRIDAADYRGAIHAFEESLEVNPQSAAAHFDLGWLYDQAVRDPAAAIYHYERYLKLRPNAGNAALVQERIEVCKQELAAQVPPPLHLAAAQRLIEQLLAQELQLQDENRRLREALNRWNAYCASLMAVRTNPTPAPEPSVVPPGPVQPTPAAVATRPAVTHFDRLEIPAAREAAASRTHTVVAGETATRIARRYGVSLESLLSVNPGLEPRRMAVGQVLNIPPPQVSMVP